LVEKSGQSRGRLSFEINRPSRPLWRIPIRNVRPTPPSLIRMTGRFLFRSTRVSKEHNLERLAERCICPSVNNWRGPCANRIRAALPSFDEQIAYSWVRQTRDTGLATLTSLDPQYPDLYEPECSIRHLRTSNRNFPSSSSPWSSRANHFVNTSGAQACDMQTSHMFKVGQTDDTELTLVSRLPAAIFNWPTRSLCPSYAG
jgi:hypothetical protein